MSDGTRDAGKDIEIGSSSSWGDPIFTGDGTTVWALPGHVEHDDDGHDHGHGSSEPATSIWAFSISGKSRDAGKDITLAGTNRDATGMATDGETLWVADHDDARVYAYTLASGARAIGREFDLHADNGLPGGMWTDGALIWVLDVTDRKAYAYKLLDGSRVPAKDYAALPSNPQGIWSDGATAWVLPERGARLSAYVAHPLSKRLLTTPTATTVKLELTRHTGNWHYKADSGPHTTCSAAQTGSAVNLTGLTAGTTYNYKAYSDGSCASEIAAAWPFTTAAPALTASYGDTELTLALSGWVAGTGAGKDGNWRYKADSGPHAACSAAQTAAAVHLSGLTAGTAYTYTAYSDGNCANVIDAAPAFTTHAANTTPALAAAKMSATSLQLTLSDYTGAWWYKYTVPTTPAGVCAAAGGATALATGLAKATSYTFKAYRAEGCANADVIATAAALSTAPTLRVSNIKSRTATLTLDGWIPKYVDEDTRYLRRCRWPLDIA